MIEVPDWPAPASVGAAVTGRDGGVSEGPFASFNLARHVGDSPARVEENRARLQAALGPLPPRLGWLEQVHGTRVVSHPGRFDTPPRADAAWTDRPGEACVVLTADCLPVLFCDQAGTRVAAAHAGWRGLAAGVLEATLAQFPDVTHVLAWLGPAIGPEAFEVGPEVREAFVAEEISACGAFRPSPSRPGHFLADLYQLARQRLEAAGVAAVHGGGRCTFSEPDRFYSYRRDGVTGRMASLVFLRVGDAQST